MRWASRAAVVLAAVVVGAIAYGSASSLNDSTRSLGSAKATVGRCDTDGLKTVYNLNTTNVASVTVSNINAGCAGATIKVTVDNKVVTSSGSTVVPAGGGSVTITITSIAVTQVMHNEISVV